MSFSDDGGIGKNMLQSKRTRHIIFSLPVKNALAKREGFEYLAYAPESGSAFLCTSAAVEKIEQELAEDGKIFPCKFFPNGKKTQTMLPHSPDDFCKLTIIPSLSCNFSCTYCYASQGRSPRFIPKQIIKHGLDYFLRPERSHKHLKIMITGGGEPLTAWTKVEYLLDYAHQLASTNGYFLYCTIMTNGALLDAEKILFLKKLGVHICVSFDITRCAQEKSRQHYDEVCSAITLGLELGAEMSVSATVTPDTVEELPEMFETVRNQFSEMKNISIEPVTSNDGFPSADAARDFYSRFLELFYKYRDPASSQRVTCSPVDFTERHISRCCPGKLCLTPQGDFSICHCVSSPHEKRYAESTYGSIDRYGHVRFDLRKFSSLLDKGRNSEERCQNCFAKYNCGGMCLTRAACYSPEIMSVYCDFIRNFVQHELESRCLREGKSCCLF